MSEKAARVTREELQSLIYYRNGHTLAKLGLFVALMAALSWLSWISEDVPVVEWLSYFAIGYLWMSLVTFMHEATHYTLFPKKWQNWLYGIVSMLPVMITFVAFKEDHMQHHIYNRSYKDPDAFTMGRRRPVDFIVFYAYAAFSIVLTMIHFTFIYPIKYFTLKLWAIHLAEIALKLLCYWALVTWAFRHHMTEDVLEVWLWPIAMFSIFNSMRFIVEHYETPWNQGKLAGTRTLTSNTVHNFFWNNINYHAGHHLYPRVPYFNLDKLFHLLEPDIKACGGVVDKSYLAVFAKALWRGPESEERLEHFLTARSRRLSGSLDSAPLKDAIQT
jgi:fatty acid desaturase